MRWTWHIPFYWCQQIKNKFGGKEGNGNVQKIKRYLRHTGYISAAIMNNCVVEDGKGGKNKRSPGGK